jgi:CheY-like chemotaxis protein
MVRVRLVHWNPAEAVEKAKDLETAGYQVDFQPLDSPAALKRLCDQLPDVVAIDLSRIPSHGREVGSALRRQKGTRHVPLVFLGGEPDKIARTRALLPDAVYADWTNVQTAVDEALHNPPQRPVVRSAMDAYTGTPPARKLGIKAGHKVALINEPGRFRETLVDLPGDVSFARSLTGQENLVVWFVSSRSELEEQVSRYARQVPDGGIWIAWPKKAAGLGSDLSEKNVREAGLAAGLVDYKIASIDRTWSGLKFARKKRQRKPPLP